MRWILLSCLAIAYLAVANAKEEKKVAIVEAKEISELVAEHRQLDTEDSEEDQVALESAVHYAEDKDGDHHHHEHGHEGAVSYAAPPPSAPAYAPAAPAYAPAPPAYVPAYAPPPPAYGPPTPRQPIPVPIPVPVRPGALVLPSLPVRPVKYPAPQPVQRPYGQAPAAYAAQPSAPVAYQAQAYAAPSPPAQQAYPQPAPPAYAQPAPSAYAAPAQAAYAPQTQAAYAPPAQVAYAPPAPAAYSPPTQAYQPAPVNQPPPQYKPAPPQVYQAPPPAPAYQQAAPQPLPQPAAYQAPAPVGGPLQVPAASQQTSYQAPSQQAPHQHAPEQAAYQAPAQPQAAQYQAAPQSPPQEPQYQPIPVPEQLAPEAQPYVAPQAEQYSAPTPAEQYSAPAPAEQYSAPAPAEQYSAPATAEQYSAPALAEQSGSYIAQRNVDQEYASAAAAAATQLQDTAPAAAFPVPSAEAWPAQPINEMPKIIAIDVKCEKSLMKVSIQFDKPFYGIIFSKNHYSNPNCVHLPAGLGRSSANFDVNINACGTLGNTENGLYGYGVQSGSGTFFENTIIIQYDPQVQEVWDQARKLRCTWHDQYEKSVTFRPFPVDMLDVVRADFAGDNVGCWMQIQVGKGPWASEVSGLVKIGQTMTMVLAIKDDENKFDMLVRNCMAHDGKRAPIQLVDQRGCVTRPKLMSRFTKIKNFGASASVLSYAHFQAFKFPDSMEVHFQCTIQICRYQCPDQCASEDVAPALPDPRIPSGQFSERMGKPREDSAARIRRDVSEKQDVGINRIIQVVSSGDLTFALEQTKDNTTTIVVPSRGELNGLVCMTSPGFAATLVILLAILVISCLLSAFLCMRHRSYGGDRSLMTSYDNPSYVHTSLKKTGFF